MIGGLGHDEAAFAGGADGHPHGQIVGLAARTGQDRMRQMRGERGAQPLQIAFNDLAQVAAVDVQKADLATDGLDHHRVTMADRGHVVVAIQVARAIRRLEPGARAALQLKRFAIEQDRGRPHVGLPPQQQRAGLGSA